MNWKKRFYQILNGLDKHRAWVIPSALAFLGAAFLYCGIESYKKKLGYGMETTNILISSKELSEGHLIVAKDLRIQPIPQKLLPIGFLLETDATKIQGLRLKRPVAKGSMLVWSDVDVDFTPTVPADRIMKGYRAISISVNAVSSIGHAIRPGDHVDIVMTLPIENDHRPHTVTLLQNISVLDVGSQTQKNMDNAYSTISLMVLPKEVGLIAFAQRHADLTLVLRNPDDFGTPRDLLMVNMSHLLATAFRNSIQEERDQRVEVIRGGRLSLSRPAP